jgi:hypothetical protein
MPVIVKRVKTLDDGTTEEYMDYIFEDANQKNDQASKMAKFLQMAQAWKQEGS